MKEFTKYGKGKQMGVVDFANEQFIPMLFGSDINSYSMARAFFEEYKVKSHVFGKYKNGPCHNSKIIEYTADKRMDEPEYMVGHIVDFANAHKDKKIIVICCGDDYVLTAAEHRDEFPDNVIVPYVDKKVMSRLQNKVYFYELAKECGLPYPDTIIYDKSMGREVEITFDYPVILKPANGVKYWRNPFKDQKKIYTIYDKNELLDTLDKIYAAGYDDKIIIQDRIPGNDENMYMLTVYCDKHSTPRFMCLGHALLEEHTPHGLGNAAVIITEHNEMLCEKAAKFLKHIGYTGYGIFDIKYDTRDGNFKFFELNTRQGRGNYYASATGVNLASMVVKEYLQGEFEGETDFDVHSCQIPKKGKMWIVVPRGVARKYIHNVDNLKKVNKMLKDGNYVNPLFMEGDNCIIRTLRMIKNHISHYKKYRIYYK